jgi:type IV fimbrial biogenesis protein FimT
MKNRPSTEFSQLLGRSQRGFTLLELMFTITVLGILLGLAVPNFKETVRNNRLISQNNEFIGALNFARSEALKRSDSVSACASTDQATCSNATDWSTGFIVFVDVNANGSKDATELLLQAFPAVPDEFTMNATNRSFLRFGSSGTSSAGAEVFNLVRTGCTGMHARRIDVTVVGRISTATWACP